jgi:hypothetical protein
MTVKPVCKSNAWAKYSTPTGKPDTIVDAPVTHDGNGSAAMTAIAALQINWKISPKIQSMKVSSHAKNCCKYIINADIAIPHALRRMRRPRTHHAASLIAIIVGNSPVNAAQKDAMKSPVNLMVVNVTGAVGHDPPEPSDVEIEPNASNKGVDWIPAHIEAASPAAVSVLVSDGSVPSVHPATPTEDAESQSTPPAAERAAVPDPAPDTPDPTTPPIGLDVTPVPFATTVVVDPATTAGL